MSFSFRLGSLCLGSHACVAHEGSTHLNVSDVRLEHSWHVDFRELVFGENDEQTRLSALPVPHDHQLLPDETSSRQPGAARRARSVHVMALLSSERQSLRQGLFEGFGFSFRVVFLMVHGGSVFLNFLLSRHAQLSTALVVDSYSPNRVMST